MVTFIASSHTALILGKYTSPGRELFSSRTSFCLQRGEKLTHVRVANIVFRSLLGREMMSPNNDMIPHDPLKCHKSLFYDMSISFYKYNGILGISMQIEFMWAEDVRAVMEGVNNQAPD